MGTEAASKKSEPAKKTGIDDKVVAAAEREMRRPAPQINAQPKKKRRPNESKYIKYIRNHFGMF